jgi:hypothetical protein
MSNRVVAIKILGLGSVDSSEPATFTTRAHPLYSPDLAGTVVSLSDQLSSEISVFGSMGSDPSTSFTILSTAATRAYLMSRGRTAVRDPSDDNQPLRVQDYILPDSGPVTLTGIDYTNIEEGGFYRIQNTAFQCIQRIPTIMQRTWGSATVPIAMGRQSANLLIGSIIYDVGSKKPRGGCEQLPVVIETVDLDSMEPEVIFRGFISKVSNDTSAGQQNLIKVDCASMMAYVKAAPFVPPWGGVSLQMKSNATLGTVVDRNTRDVTAYGYTLTTYDSRLYGQIYNPDERVTGATLVKAWQIRQEGNGGIGRADTTSVPGKVAISNAWTLNYGGGTITAEALSNGYVKTFSDGYFDKSGVGMLEFGLVEQSPSDDVFSDTPRYTNSMTDEQPGFRGENCFFGITFSTIIIDLLLGSFNANITMSDGARSATESAWLPFPVNDWTDIIDAPSLHALTEGLADPDVPVDMSELIDTFYNPINRILPYEHKSVKTVGEVLEAIFKRLAAYMVYDKGKFYFGSWAGARQTPTFVNDSALSDPSIKLTFERGLSVMRVNAKYCTDVVDKKPVSFDVPYQNPDLANSGLGKTLSVGHWCVFPYPPNDFNWAETRMVANAFGLVMRYSQSAARVDVTLRDAVVDLTIGQEVALSSDYIVNSDGEMGVSLLTGYVLKAARSWSTPTTAYTIILPGYLSPAAHVSVWSVSALIIDIRSVDKVELEANFYTAPPIISSEGAPISDTDAFRLSTETYGGPFDVQLLDGYGTLKGQFPLLSIDVPNNLMEFTGIGAAAAIGDIIVLAPATFFGAGLDTVWDVFQADSSGQVARVTNNARQWVP